jgi:AraC family transcriptional regulator, transcriptional activator of pobA
MPIRSVPNYDGLYGDSTLRANAEYIFLELITTRSQIFDWKIEPHTHTSLFQVFIVEKGTFVFQETIQKYTLTAPCICFVPPVQLHGLIYTPDVQGYILTVSENIIEDLFKTSSDIFKTFENIQIMNSFGDEKAFDYYLNLIRVMEKELFSDHSERLVIFKAYLVQLFVKIHRMKQEGDENKNDSLTMSYYRRFQKSIKHSDYHKSIPAFAEELQITAVHLNRICRAASGKSAIELVHQNLVSEAQKYLLHSSYSISEIAYLLQFEYPNYFAKLFKKYTGSTPVEFRLKYRK